MLGAKAMHFASIRATAVLTRNNGHVVLCTTYAESLCLRLATQSLLGTQSTLVLARMCRR